MSTSSGYINVLGIEHHYCLLKEELLSAEKPLLVFLHEGLGSIAQWKDFPALLCDKVNLPALLFDRYGHGKSEKLKAPREMNFMHQQAQQFLPELLRSMLLQDKKIILIGHSDGGSIALIHAGRFPENIAGVLTEAAHIFLEEISLIGIRQAVKMFEDGQLRKLLSRFHGAKTESMFYGWAGTWLNPDFRQWNIEDYLSRISAPVMALQGDNDQYGSYAQLEGISKHVKNSRVELLANCGHIPHL
jgi:pimeloyl-ACP methyl ester carboxylesterase